MRQKLPIVPTVYWGAFFKNRRHFSDLRIAFIYLCLPSPPQTPPFFVCSPWRSGPTASCCDVIKQVQKMQVNISPRLEKPTIYFSGFDKRTGAELAGRLGKETWLVCLIGSISVAGFDQATGERNAGASHDHIMKMSTLSQGVGSERGCSLRSFFNCKCSPIQCFPGRRSFKISTKRKSSLGPDCRWPKLGQT